MLSVFYKSLSMRHWLSIIKWAIAISGLAFTTLLAFVIFDKAYFHYGGDIDTDLAAKFGDFVGGFIGTLFGFLSVLVLAYSILKQTYETRRNNIRNAFFKMIDYHFKNVEQVELPKPDNPGTKEKARRGFVAYKIQIKRLLQAVCKINSENELELTGHDVASIAYMVFYYGADESWKTFLKNKLACYDCSELMINCLIKLSERNPNMKLCRTNQTILSAYFRNMYNAIRLVDSEPYFTKKEKYDLIKIYRAQLSNPELYVLFFNVISPFGKKWREKDFVNKYRLVKNIPHGYLDGYDMKEYFDMKYEYEEVNCETDSDNFPQTPPPDIKSGTSFSCKSRPKKRKWIIYGGIAHT